MKIRMLAGVACAALTILAAPATAAMTRAPHAVLYLNASADPGRECISTRRAAARPCGCAVAPTAPRRASSSACSQRAPLDGLASGPALAAEAQALIARAQSGDPAALAQAERLLSTAWVLYVAGASDPARGNDLCGQLGRAAPRYAGADPRSGRGRAFARRLCAHRLAGEPDLRAASRRRLDADAGERRSGRSARTRQPRPGPRHARPGRYVMVDTAGARLYMIEDGRIADSMKVIVGKSDPVDPDADARQHDLLRDAQPLLARYGRSWSARSSRKTCSTRASAI